MTTGRRRPIGLRRSKPARGCWPLSTKSAGLTKRVISMSTDAERQAAENNLRDLGIDPGEALYDGPDPGNITQFPQHPGAMSVALNVPQPAPVVSRAQYVDTITVALNVLSARLLGMIAVV